MVVAAVAAVAAVERRNRHPVAAVAAVEWMNHHPVVVVVVVVEADCRCPSAEKAGVAVVVAAVPYSMRYRIRKMAEPRSNLLELTSM